MAHRVEVPSPISVYLEVGSFPPQPEDLSSRLRVVIQARFVPWAGSEVVTVLGKFGANFVTPRRPSSLEYLLVLPVLVLTGLEPRDYIVGNIVASPLLRLSALMQSCI